MAYAATITYTSAGKSGAGILQIVEVEAAATSESEIVLATYGIPPIGRIHTQLCRLTAGTGTTVDPVIGDTTDPAAAATWKIENATAAALIHNQPDSAVRYAGITSFFHRAVPNNAAADHSITTTYYISEGWE